MSFKKAADGVTQSGKTKGKNLGDSGKTVAIQSDKAGKAGKGGGKTDANMLSMGRGMAKVANQKRG